MNELTHHKCSICMENFQLSGARLVHHLRNHSPPSIAQLLNDLIINETFQATDEDYDYFFEFTTSFRRSVRVNVVDDSTSECYSAAPDLVAVKMETLESSEDELTEPIETDPLFASAVTLPVREPDDSMYAKRMRLNHQEDEESFQSEGDNDSFSGNFEMLPFEFTPGARKGSILLYSISEKQLYRLKNDYVHCKRYVCTVKTCRATLYLRGNHLNKARKFKGHFHCIQVPGSKKHRRNVKSKPRNQLLTPKVEATSGEPTCPNSKNAESLPFEFTPGARIGSILLYSTGEKQLYRLKNVFTNYKRYVCTVKTCRATLVLRGNHLSKAPQFKDHNHADQELVAAKNKFEASFKSKCMQDDSADPCLLFNTLMSEDPVGGRNTSYDKMKSHLNHRKRAVSKYVTPSADAKHEIQMAISRESISDEPTDKCQSPIGKNTKNTVDELVRGSHHHKKENTETDEHLPFEFTPGARLGSTLLYSISEKQLYRLKNVFTNYRRYVCNVKTCRATLFLRGNVLSKAPQFKDHNHGDQESVVAKNKFQTSCRAKCLEDGIDPSLVFTMMLNEDPVGGRNSSFDKMKRHLSRLKTVRTKAPPTSDTGNQLLMADSRKFSFEENRSVGISDEPAETCQAVNYTPPIAKYLQYDSNLGAMAEEVDRSLTQESRHSPVRQPMFDQHLYY